jgi:NADH-quinone oxidoreductase subunit K
MINIQYITLGFILFIIATFGIIINRKNLIVLLMCIELALLSINFILIISSSYLDNIVGELFAFYILVVAAAESAIGLSILVSYYRIKGTISVKFINLLKG